MHLSSVIAFFESTVKTSYPGLYLQIFSSYWIILNSGATAVYFIGLNLLQQSRNINATLFIS
jgi:hypothetical protein